MKTWLAFLLLLGLSATMAFLPTHRQIRPSFTLLAAKKKNHNKAPSTKFSMSELKKRIAETSPDLWFHPPAESLPGEFFIVLVQPGTPQQGVHTIESHTGSNLILAFEDDGACENFAEQLRAQNFVNPTPQQITLESLDAFCHQLGIFAEFIPKGIDLIAPSRNVEKFGLKDPSLKEKRHELDYIFAMEETEIVDSEGTLETMGSWE